MECIFCNSRQLAVVKTAILTVKRNLLIVQRPILKWKINGFETGL